MTWCFSSDVLAGGITDPVSSPHYEQRNTGALSLDRRAQETCGVENNAYWNNLVIVLDMDLKIESRYFSFTVTDVKYV